ncbi:MAG TPA: AzlD domain-containing protein [Roseiflexaceae bacterium]|nr:AzlD domain-containing protein [Roseiflexaceae bacterium]
MFWLMIVGMGLVTYATRVTALLALRGPVAPWLQRWLGFVPVAVFTALIVPELLLQSGQAGRTVVLGPALVAGLVGVLVAWRGGNVLLTIAAGMATFWLLRWLGM